MANVIINDANLTAIGDAIRAKNGTTTTYKPREMAAAIEAIQTGGGSGGGGDDSAMKEQLVRVMNDDSQFTFTIPAGVTQIPKYTFYQRANLTDVTFEDESLVTYIRDYAFSGCSNMRLPNGLPSNLISVQQGAFEGCFGDVDLLVIPATVTMVNYTSFSTAKMKRVRFLGKPNIIRNTAFNVCPNLTDIYVPWAEGAVASAPWGASNATIHYNTPADAVIE